MNCENKNTGCHKQIATLMSATVMKI